MRQAILFILLITSLSLFAQTFTGKVTDRKGEPLVGASVVVTTESSSTAAYCLTNVKGFYKLNVSEKKNSQECFDKLHRVSEKDNAFLRFEGWHDHCAR